MIKKKICILFGGVSVEHEISIISANSILNNIDRKIFDIQGLYLNKNGDFQICDMVKMDLWNDHLLHDYYPCQCSCSSMSEKPRGDIFKHCL